jgi:hypothetical protein
MIQRTHPIAPLPSVANAPSLRIERIPDSWSKPRREHLF